MEAAEAAAERDGPLDDAQVSALDAVDTGVPPAQPLSGDGGDAARAASVELVNVEGEANVVDEAREEAAPAEAAERGGAGEGAPPVDGGGGGGSGAPALSGAELEDAVLALFTSSPPAFVEANAEQVYAALGAGRGHADWRELVGKSRREKARKEEEARLAEVAAACDALADRPASSSGGGLLLRVAPQPGLSKRDGLHAPLYISSTCPERAAAAAARFEAGAAAHRAALAAASTAAREGALWRAFGPGGALSSGSGRAVGLIRTLMKLHGSGCSHVESLTDSLEKLRKEGLLKREAGGLYSTRREGDPPDVTDDEAAAAGGGSGDESGGGDDGNGGGAAGAEAAASPAHAAPSAEALATVAAAVAEAAEAEAAAASAGAAARAAADASAASAIVAHTYDDVGDGALPIVGGYSAAEEAAVETAAEAVVRTTLPRLFDPKKPLANRSATLADIVSLLSTDNKVYQAVAPVAAASRLPHEKAVELTAETVLRRLVASGAVVAFEVGCGFRGMSRRAIRYCPAEAHREVRSAEADARGPDAATLRAELLSLFLHLPRVGSKRKANAASAASAPPSFFGLTAYDAHASLSYIRPAMRFVPEQPPARGKARAAPAAAKDESWLLGSGAVHAALRQLVGAGALRSTDGCGADARTAEPGLSATFSLVPGLSAPAAVAAAARLDADEAAVACSSAVASEASALLQLTRGGCAASCSLRAQGAITKGMGGRGGERLALHRLVAAGALRHVAKDGALSLVASAPAVAAASAAAAAAAASAAAAAASRAAKVAAAAAAAPPAQSKRLRDDAGAGEGAAARRPVRGAAAPLRLCDAAPPPPPPKHRLSAAGPARAARKAAKAAAKEARKAAHGATKEARRAAKVAEKEARRATKLMAREVSKLARKAGKLKRPKYHARLVAAAALLQPGVTPAQIEAVYARKPAAAAPPPAPPPPAAGLAGGASARDTSDGTSDSSDDDDDDQPGQTMVESLAAQVGGGGGGGAVAGGAGGASHSGEQSDGEPPPGETWTLGQDPEIDAMLDNMQYD